MEAEGRAVRRSRARRGIFVSPLARIVRCQIHGQPVFFTVVNPRDEIQRHHMDGSFYEPEELAIIGRYFPLGGRFLDIGTNVGNHTVYVSKFLHASRVVCFEPNPEAIAVLESNVWLNGLQHIVEGRYLGIGLSDHDSESASMVVPRRNLGGGRVVEGTGDIRLARADALLADQIFDMIKIDVEGHELAVLAGLEGLLRQHKPKLFIEVDKANAAGFAAWLKSARYEIVEEFKRYRNNTNYLVRAEA